MNGIKAGKNIFLISIVMTAIFTGMIGSAAAYIEIRELGIDETQNATGFVDFKNVVDDIFLGEGEDYNVAGVLTVYNDGTLIHEEEIELEVISFHGFVVNRPETIEFTVNTSEGTHKLTAYIESEEKTVEEAHEYEGEIVEEEEEEEEEDEETEVDWLPCPSRREGE
jgi:hypothetical protein